MILFSAVLFCLFFLTSYSSAYEWYVRPFTGKYGLEDGTTYANAFRGWSGIQWKKIKPGDIIFFCGNFYAPDEKNRIYVGASGSPTDGYIYLKSCTVANGAPLDDPWVVDWRSSIPDWRIPSRWGRDGNSHCWSMVLNTPYLPRRLYFLRNGNTSTIEGQRQCHVSAVSKEHDWYVDRSNKTLFVYAGENPATLFASLKSNNFLFFGAAIEFHGDWIDLSGLTSFGQGGDYLLRISGRTNVRIHGMKAYDSGTIAIVSNSEIPPYRASTNIEIYDNQFDSRFTGNNADADCMDAAVGAGIYLWGSVQNSKIYRNTIRNYMKSIGLLGCAENCDSLSRGVENNEVFENDVSCPDLKYGYAYLSGGTTQINRPGYLRNNRIFNNYFHDFTNGVAVAGENTLFANNIIHNVFESTRKGKSKTCVGITTGGIGGENNILFAGNTISRTKEACIKVWDVDNNVRGYEFTDNTLSDCAYSALKDSCSIILEDNGNGLRPNHFIWKRNHITNSKRGGVAPEVKYRGIGMPAGEWNQSASHGDVIENNSQQ
jgi:hypothetical protein